MRHWQATMKIGVAVTGFLSFLLHSRSAQSFTLSELTISKTSASKGSRCTLIRSRMSTNESSEWSPLNPESLVAAPCLIEQTLCVQPGSPHDPPQLAKDFAYATAVLDAWKQQEADSDDPWTAETRAVAYQSASGTPLYGHLVRRATTTTTVSIDKNVPGILLFHTGAGPHDVFLLWKAAALVSTTIDGVVFIADCLGDDTGWSWKTDRTQYNEARTTLLAVDDATNTRPVLQDRTRAAVATLSSVPGVDGNNLAALGWCLGGHAVLELGRMRLTGMRAMVTFHGVFDGLAVPAADLEHAGDRTEVLICHGTQDPFVPDQALERALETFTKHRQTVSLLQLKGAKHGFTNPAQDFNDNPAFAFSKEAADKAWRQTNALLQRTLTKASAA